ncbi:MAG: YqgE/AlgH family protein [Dehalococcoidia bacterium]
MHESLAGRLLVATPLLEDPSFARTVVLVCTHTAEGALGVVLNRPLEEPVAAHLPDWTPRLTGPPVFFGGGPVQPSTVLALGRDRTGMAAPWWTRVTAEVGLLDLDWAPADLSDSLDAVRLFAGHAGWGGGQLDHEIAQEAWFVLDATPDDPFVADPGDLWRHVLRRQRGMLSMFATYPRDLSAN